MKYKFIYAVAAVAAISGFWIYSSISLYDFTRLLKNIDIGKRGVKLEYGYVPTGMYAKPVIIDFSSTLLSLSRGTVDLDILNTYTVGNFKKYKNTEFPDISNFLDPGSKFKDSWFGVFIIFNDEGMRARRFILINSGGDPDDQANLNPDSILSLPALDQRLIVMTTHQGERDYGLHEFNRDFMFEMADGYKFTRKIICDQAGRKWLKIEGAFNTISALTDISRTNMKRFSSIRSYVGLPVPGVYRIAGPWHRIVIRGTTFTRYFKCEDRGFWAVVYYNGSRFIDGSGRTRDTWDDTDLKIILEKMFNSLVISCR